MVEFNSLFEFLVLLYALKQNKKYQTIQSIGLLHFLNVLDFLKQLSKALLVYHSMFNGSHFMTVIFVKKNAPNKSKLITN